MERGSCTIKQIKLSILSNRIVIQQSVSFCGKPQTTIRTSRTIDTGWYIQPISRIMTYKPVHQFWKHRNTTGICTNPQYLSTGKTKGINRKMSQWVSVSTVIGHLLYITCSKVKSKNTVICSDKQLSVPLHKTANEIIFQTTIFTCIMSNTVITQVNAI